MGWLEIAGGHGRPTSVEVAPLGLHLPAVSFSPGLQAWKYRPLQGVQGSKNLPLLPSSGLAVLLGRRWPGQVSLLGEENLPLLPSSGLQAGY